VESSERRTAGDPERLTLTERAIARLRAGRERQGLPPVVTDPAVLARVAAVLRAAETEQ
jgi:hypothetical protein